MTTEPRLRTVEVARASGYSVQQVRDLERLGVLPHAARAQNGYRVYARVHVQALQAYRGLASAAGPVDARRLLVTFFAGSRARPPVDRAPGALATAVAAINGVHVRLARERDEALRAREALCVIQAEADLPDGDQAGGVVTEVMTITELAGALGVRASTLRFWEQEGLVAPERVTTVRARQYGTAAVRQARIVAALRGSGYGISAVRDVVAGLGGRQGATDALRILDRRIDQITDRTIALLRAGAVLADLLAPE